jgi:hypothetical protein
MRGVTQTVSSSPIPGAMGRQADPADVFGRDPRAHCRRSWHQWVDGRIARFAFGKAAEAHRPGSRRAIWIHEDARERVDSLHSSGYRLPLCPMPTLPWRDFSCEICCPRLLRVRRWATSSTQNRLQPGRPQRLTHPDLTQQYGRYGNVTCRAAVKEVPQVRV